MSNLSELLPSGGGQNVGSFVASGTIANGAVVGLTSDGKVSILDPSGVGSTSTVSPATGNIGQSCSVYDDTRNVVHVVYKHNNTQYINHIAGSISGSTITFGTESVVVTENPKDIDIAMNSTIGLPIVAFCQGTGGNVKVRSGTGGSGTTMGWSGNLLTVQAGDNNNVFIRNDPPRSDGSNGETFIIFNRENPNGRLMGAALETNTSGTTSIRLGPTTLYYTSSRTAVPMGLFYDANVQSHMGCFNYHNYSTGEQSCQAFQANIQTTQIAVSPEANIGVTFGTGGTAVEEPLTSNTGRMGGSGNGKVVMTGAFQEGTVTSTRTFRAYVITANGTSQAPTVASAVDMIPGVTGSQYFGMTTMYDSNASKFVTVFGYVPNSYYISVITSTLSGTTLTVDPGITNLQSSGLYYDGMTATYSAHSNNVFIWSMTNPASSALAGMYTVGSLELDSFIGLAGQAISDTATGNVDMLGGINSQQTSLVIGSKYYVQDNGTLGTTVTSTFAGQAISATTLNIRDLT
jgi:hypothetical protein